MCVLGFCFVFAFMNVVFDMINSIEVRILMVYVTISFCCDLLVDAWFMFGLLD